MGRAGQPSGFHRQSGTAQLLPCLIAHRSRAPLFLTDRKAPARTPTLDVCPETGRARLSYRRAEEIFEENTRPLANPLASPEDIEDLDGWTLHRPRHSARPEELVNLAMTAPAEQRYGSASNSCGSPNAPTSRR
ncbi:hypothetical protein ACFVTY_04290 [Streptomyces sp. NPDC058067]|uniref:hypothetical protein n=1 Tax=Streptomyces sp. NPDC058067 TaxID=3346324 RepID=UPI0036E2E269